MKSKVKSKKPIKFGKTLVVRKLTFNDNSLNSTRENIRQHRPEATAEEIENEVMDMVKKDNQYNVVMDEVASAYEFELDESEINEKVAAAKQNWPDSSDESILSMVQITVYKALIYDDLASDWEILITDDEVKSTLEHFYKSTGQPIREYLMNKEKFEEVRTTIRDQIISDRLMNAFRVEFNLSDENKESVS